MEHPLHTVHGLLQGKHVQQVALHPVDAIEERFIAIMSEHAPHDGGVAPRPRQRPHQTPAMQQFAEHMHAHDPRTARHQVHAAAR